jgi:ribonucleotide monophosphatase NagD (HAD superfamily)
VSGARALGWDSALVLTGVTSRADLDGASDRPTFVLEDVRGLVD